MRTTTRPASNRRKTTFGGPRCEGMGNCLYDGLGVGRSPRTEAVRMHEHLPEA